MNVGIVGCGLIGGKRARALGNHRLVAVSDAVPVRAAALAATHPDCVAESQWQMLVSRADVDVVIAATSNDALAPVAVAALAAGKHVLLEKPGARSVSEIDTLMSAADRAQRLVKVGFNHRYHPALRKARLLVDDGAIGELLYVRGRYGHGGRPGYDREWRADPERSGGGELLDQGVHLIDLARWFLGDFVEVTGRLATFFWKMPVEDNGFLLLTTARAQVAWLHASWTEWKIVFSFEIIGATGKLQIDGLGGSYGVERLTWYRMLPEMGPPETTIWEYPQEDRSWSLELDDFASAIERGVATSPSLADARAALVIVERVYAEARRASGEAAPR
jgi:predicted dehydrogenase